MAGEMPNPNLDETETLALAKACYRAFLPGADWQSNYQGQGRFLGGTIFELWGKAPSSSLQHHIIIALYPYSKSIEQTTPFIPNWLNLFAFRHKILWANRQSQTLKKRLQPDFVVIEECMNGLTKKVNLKELDRLLVKAQNTLAVYATDLHDLEYQARTIEINLHNYNKWLAVVPEKVDEIGTRELLPEPINFLIKVSEAITIIPSIDIYSVMIKVTNLQCDLKFLAKFSDENAETYLLQVQKDYDNFSPGLRLLEVLINSIRATVEVHKANRDRNLEIIAGSVGFGLTITSILAGISAQFPTVIVPADILTYEDDPNPARQHPIGKVLSQYLHVPDAWLAPSISAVVSIVPLLLTMVIASIWIFWRNRGQD